MTAAEKREIFRQALALPEKARWALYNRLCESLDAPPKRKVKAVYGTRKIAEPTVVYGRKNATKRSKKAIPQAEDVPKKEWNEAWKGELEKRIEEIDSGKVKCIPHAEVRRELDRILGKS